MSQANDPKPPLVLTVEERRSPLWRKLLAHFEERLTTLRIQNDGDKSEAATANLRGRIAEMKTLLLLDKDQPKIESPPL